MSFPAVRPARWQWWAFLLLGGWIGWLVGGRYLTTQPFGFLTYLGWVAWGGVGLGLAYLTYHGWAVLRLQYIVTRDGIGICWGWNRFFVPMQEVTQVASAAGVARTTFWWRGPALYVGTTREEGRRVYGFSTIPWDRALILGGPRVLLVMSPQDREGFLNALNARRRLGPNRVLSLGWERPRWARWALWRDAPALLALITAGMLVLLLWGEAAWRVENSRLLGLVQLASLLLMANTLLGLLVYARERPAALALWWGGVGILLVLLIGLWTGYLLS